MGECCDLMTLSMASAGLQIVGVVLVVLFLGIMGAVTADDDFSSNDDGLGFVLCIVIILFGLIALGLLITLILGIQQNRRTFVAIYVYPTIVALAIDAICIFYNFVEGFFDNEETSEIFLSLFLHLLTFGIEVLLLCPILMFFNRMRKGGTR